MTCAGVKGWGYGGGNARDGRLIGRGSERDERWIVRGGERDKEIQRRERLERRDE